jgi:hypothetical protein
MTGEIARFLLEAFQKPPRGIDTKLATRGTTSSLPRGFA